MTTLPFWIQDTDKLWMKGNFAPFGTNVYYLEKGGNNSPSIDDVLAFGDDFANLNKWTIAAGTWDTSNNYLECTAGASSSVDATIATINEFVIEFDVVITQLTETGNYIDFIVYNAASDTGYGVLLNHDDGGSGNVTRIQEFTDVSAITTSTEGIATTGITDANSHHIKFTHDGNGTMKLYIDDTLYCSLTDSTVTDFDKIRIFDRFYDSSHEKRTDGIVVRKYTPAEPTVKVIDLGSNRYKVIVHNEAGETLEGHQFAIPASSIGVTTSTDSYEIVAEEQALPAMYPDLLADLVHYWDFNSDACDTVGNGNGTVNGATLTTDRFGIQNNAYAFDGGNDWITVGQLMNGWSEYTIICCVKVTDTSADRGLFCNWNDERQLLIWHDAPDGWQGIQCQSGSVTKMAYTGIVASGDYEYITMASKNGSTIDTWVDENKTIGDSITENVLSVTVSARIGCDVNDLRDMLGNIDFVMVFNKKLSDDYIKTIIRLMRHGYLYPIRRSLE